LAAFLQSHSLQEETGSVRSSLKAFVNDPSSSTGAAVFQASVLFLILASSAAVIVETLPEFHGMSFLWLEAIVTLIFTVELGLRLVVADSIVGFFTNAFNIVDLVAVLPGYFEFFSWADKDAIHTVLALRMLRVMWFIRILRLLKVARHFPFLAFTLSVVYHVLTSSALLILAVVGFLMVVSASLLYLVESDRCEELGLPCEGFESIPASFWFSICTLTTVGYGDVIPLTSSGKALASFIAVCAVIIMALAGALLYFNFCEVMPQRDLNRHLGGEEATEQAQDLQHAAKELKEAWDQLFQKLGVAAHGRHVVMGRPALQLLEERGRIFCAETQGFLNVLLRTA